MRAIRGKATTHWRAAAWLLERIDPQQFAKYNSKLLTPEEVGDLLGNISSTLNRAINEPCYSFLATEIVDAAREQANLPFGRRNVYAQLNDEPLPGLPGRLDDIRSGFGLSNSGELDVEEAEEIL